MTVFEDSWRSFVMRVLERKLTAAGEGDKIGALSELVKVAPAPAPAPGAEGALQLRRWQVSFRISELGVSLNARDADLLGWTLSAARSGSTQQLSEREALARAQAAVVVPATAELSFAGYEEVGGVPFFVAHWEHREGGVLVEKDFIRVTVNGKTGAICGVSRRWHEVDTEPSVR